LETAATTSQWWRRLVNAYEVKAGYLPLPRKRSPDGVTVYYKKETLPRSAQVCKLSHNFYTANTPYHLPQCKNCGAKKRASFLQRGAIPSVPLPLPLIYTL